MVFCAAKEPGPNRLGALYAAANFGVIDIDWWERKMTLALRDEAGTRSDPLFSASMNWGLPGDRRD